MKPAGTMPAHSSVPAFSSAIICCRVALSLPMSRTVVTPAARLQAAVPAADVAVHVEQAGQQHAAAGVDDVVGLRALPPPAR